MLNNVLLLMHRRIALPHISGVWHVLVGTLLYIFVACEPAMAQVETKEDVTSVSSITPSQLFDLVSPAVVTIVALDVDHQEIGSGSGFVLDIAKLNPVFEQQNQIILNELWQYQGKRVFTIATCYHVIRAAAYARVEFSDGDTGEVMDVLAESADDDVAILRIALKLQVDELTQVEQDILFIEKHLSASDQIKEEKNTLVIQSQKPLSWSPITLEMNRSYPVGSEVFAIGNPKGLTNTLSNGLISGYRDINQHKKWIQITAPISPGSSGGPLLNVRGPAIGMTTAYIENGQNLNFAIPAHVIGRPEYLLDSGG